MSQNMFGNGTGTNDAQIVFSSGQNKTFPQIEVWVVWGWLVGEEFDSFRMYGVFGFRSDAEECLKAVKERCDSSATPGSMCGMSRSVLNDSLTDEDFEKIEKRIIDEQGT